MVFAFFFLFVQTVNSLEITGDQGVSGVPGEVVTVSIFLGNIATHPGLTVESLDLDVLYDYGQLEFITGRPGAAFNGGSFTPASIFNDINGLVLSSTTIVIGFSIAENQELLQLDFRIRDTASAGPSQLDIIQANINEDEFEQALPGPDSTDGIITVTALADGDVNIDGQVNISDLLLMQQGSLSYIQLTAAQIQHADIAPQSGPDGIVDLKDVLALQKLILGL